MEPPPGTAAVRVSPPSFSPSSSSSPYPDGIVAVGFIGSSSATDPTHLLNRILDSHIFGSGRADREFVARSDWFKNRRISYHCDDEKGVVLLQFSSCLSPLEAFSQSGMEESEQEDLKAMLFMFSVCHIVIFLHNGSRFDTQILKKFRILQSSKHALLPFLNSQNPNSNSNSNSNSKPSAQQSSSSVLPGGGLSARHLSTQFSPVILFVFQDNFSPDASISMPNAETPVIKTLNSNRKRLILHLESQIRYLLKKLHLSSRFSGNSTYTPLFSLDPSRSVSLLDSSTNQKAEPLNHISNLLNSSNLINENTSHFVNSEEVQGIWDFISRNSEILKGSITGNSNPGSVAAAAIKAATSASTVKPDTGLVDLPNLENFLALSKSILNSLISSKYDNKGVNEKNDYIEGVLCNLEKSKGVNEKFSVFWCEKTIPICIEVYLKDLPKYYRTDMHEKHLKKALDVFRSTVKGPAVKRFAEKLEKECNLIWENGRQQCDSLSLTKRPCVHQKHNNFNNDNNSKGDLVNLQHSSGFYFLHACACGRSRALRDDPFKLETGQDTFNAGFKCEKLVPTIEIPNKNGMKSIWRLVRIGSSKYYNPKKGILQTGFCNKEKFLFRWKIKIKKGINNDNDNNELFKEMGEFNIGKSEGDFSKNVYENFIMKKPFSEVVKNENKNTFSHEENKNEIVLQIGDNIIPVNTKNIGTKMNNSTEEFNAYLGFEHECPYGHRFLLSEQHLNQLDSTVHQRNNNNNNNSNKRNNNSEEFCILTRKLPIFMNCPHCVGSDERENNQKVKFAGKISQLQRIFIVTPQFPVLLATCPVVQFEESCLPDSVSNKERESRFGFESRVLLPPDSFLSLRLPFIYAVKTDSGDLYPLDLFETRPDKTAWLVEGSALELVSVGKEEE